MHIVLVNDDLPATGGNSSVSAIVENLARQYSAVGHTVTVLTSHRAEVSSQIIRLPGVISLPISYRISLRQYHCLYSPRVSAMLKRELRALTPDVVHAHNIHAYLTYDVLRIAKKLGAKVFITLHDVLSFSSWRVSTPSYLGSARDAHLTMADHWRSGGLQYNPLRNVWIRHIYKTSVDRVCAVSSALQVALAQNGIRKVTVVHNGIDLHQWQKPESATLTDFIQKQGIEGRRVLFFGGRLSNDKGSAQVLRAVQSLYKEFPEVLLFVAGEKKIWAVLQKETGMEESDIAKYCQLAGWLSPEEMRLAYYASEVVTTPSLCLDCFPSTNLEAMACGKPVVGTVFGGTPEAVQHGVTGFVCDPRNPEYQDFLAQLFRSDALRKDMGEAGRKRAEEQFSLAQQADTYIRLYEEVSR